MSVFVRTAETVHTCAMYGCKSPAKTRLEEWERGDFYGATHLCDIHLSFALGKSSVVQS